MTDGNQPEIEKKAWLEAWRVQCDYVTESMKAHTRAFVSPLSTENEREVRHVGTGSFLCLGARRMLLTCEHVATEGPINFSLHGSGNVFSATSPFCEEKLLDVAFVPVSDAVWAACEHEAKGIPAERVAGKHQPSCREEMFFFHGFAGENSHYGFGTMESTASAYVTQQSADALEEGRIFELFWEPQETTFVESASVEVRKTVRITDPGGFSGSIVWNTRYREVTLAGQCWTPQHAVISGLLKRWDTATKTLLVTRIEHLRDFLQAAVS